MRNTEPTNNVLPNEVRAYGLGDRGQRLDLYPLGEVINWDDIKVSLSTGSREWSDQVYTPLCERLRANNQRQWFWSCFDHEQISGTYHTSEQVQLNLFAWSASNILI